VVSDIWQMEDLRKRVLFTLGMIAVYRLGIFIPAPGIDRSVLTDWFSQQGGSLFGLYDMFSGGALQQYSVFMLGIMPYISASIVMQMAAEFVPTLKRIKEEGQTGRGRITQYTRYLTILIAVGQSFSFAVGMENMQVGSHPVVLEGGWPFRLLSVITMTAGSCFVMWLGEQMTERGVGNGSSILISSGIIARIPSAAAKGASLISLGELTLLSATVLLMFMFFVICAIVFIERGQRRVPLQYAKRVLGRSLYAGASPTYLPLKMNTSGVIPPIFASSVLMFPGTIGQFWDNQFVQWLANAFHPGQWAYNLTYIVLIFLFGYFYTAITFNADDVAENLKKQGGYIPKVRPGKDTAMYIDWILNRLTAAGAAYLAAVCILPSIMVTQAHVPFAFGGTGLLILCGVTLDTVAQVEAQLNTRHYDGLVGPGAAGVKRRQPIGGVGSGGF
jgi:preprotein translocase subunit SecY